MKKLSVIAFAALSALVFAATAVAKEMSVRPAERLVPA